MAALIEEIVRPSEYLLALVRKDSLQVVDPSAAAPLASYQLPCPSPCPPLFLRNYQQLLCPQVDKSFLTVFNSDSDKVASKLPLSEKVRLLTLSHCQELLFAITASDKLVAWELFTGAKLAETQAPASHAIALHCHGHSLVIVGEAIVARLTLS
jgi:hypothetical protein